MRYQAQEGVPSENGWPMYRGHLSVVTTVVPAAKGVPLRRGDVATILNAFIILYNRRVEPIVSQVWGYSWDNDVWNSNHMSGTAIDINAPMYPWGAYRMPADRIAKVRSLVNDFEGTVFWGRDWARPDEMHFQIGLPPSNPRVAAFAAKLNNGHLGAYGSPPPAPAPKPATPGGITVSEADRIINFIKGYVGPIGSDVKDVRQQITGGRDAGEYPGWPQLGKNSKGENLTLVDAVAALRRDLDNMRKENK